MNATTPAQIAETILNGSFRPWCFDSRIATKTDWLMAAQCAVDGEAEGEGERQLEREAGAEGPELQRDRRQQGEQHVEHHAAHARVRGDVRRRGRREGFHEASSGGGGSAANKDYRRQIPAAFSSDSVGKLVMTDAAMRASAYQVYGGSGVGTGYQTPYQLVDSANRLGGLAVPGALYASQNARTITPITAPVDAAIMATDGLVIEWVDRTNGYVYDLYYHK